MAVIPISAGRLRHLKNALQDRFPTAKSSHLSEALAAGLGFRTNAALLSWMLDSGLEPDLSALNEQSFVARMADFGYAIDQAFSPEELRLLGTGVLMEFRANVNRLLVLERNPNSHWDEIGALRRSCATLFAKAFGLGYAEPFGDDKNVVNRMCRGIDYKACRTGWGRAVNVRHPSINFPGADHQVRFYERLPLSDGKFVEYSTAVVSMPYTGADSTVPELPKAREFAERIGWTCTELKDWTWYAAEATTLVLFRRTTSYEEMEKAWATSFKRWLIENRSRLASGIRGEGRKLIQDVIDCQHFPLDVVNYEDCRERYLKEFSARLYRDEGDPMTKALHKLFEEWRAELKLAEFDVAFGLTK
ncbi:hypothetical protein PO883_33735 [Massilia sp. DJPM01]|uniref:hypothetical protein n=1 Tax=Massilia sp. DJPM01 TaxID=3024404 RepID=UPI00259FC02C|nr:hypothetical protein [Massilia sp. DJPM01]MDM5182135.1 hypothetical protein [Massilia sp. DJPM01]